MWVSKSNKRHRHHRLIENEDHHQFEVARVLYRPETWAESKSLIGVTESSKWLLTIIECTVVPSSENSMSWAEYCVIYWSASDQWHQSIRIAIHHSIEGTKNILQHCELPCLSRAYPCVNVLQGWFHLIGWYFDPQITNTKTCQDLHKVFQLLYLPILFSTTSPMSS